MSSVTPTLPGSSRTTRLAAVPLLVSLLLVGFSAAAGVSGWFLVGMVGRTLIPVCVGAALIAFLGGATRFTPAFFGAAASAAPAVGAALALLYAVAALGQLTDMHELLQRVDMALHALLWGIVVGPLTLRPLSRRVADTTGVG